MIILKKSRHKKYIYKINSLGSYLVLTSCGLVAVVAVPEILRVFDYWDTSHADYHSVWPGI